MSKKLYIDDLNQSQMPINPGLIAAGASLLGNVFSSVFGNQANTDQKNFTREMYDRQRKDGLADWNAQNLYNSPEMQMQRLRNAGLNPNLVYGSGAVGNAAATVRASSSGSYSPKPAQFDPGSAMAQYVNTQQSVAQIDLLKAQQKATDQEAFLKAVQAQNIAANTDSTRFDLGVKSSTLGNTLATSDANLRKLEQSIGIDAEANTRANIQLGLNARTTLQSLVNSEIDNALKKAQTSGAYKNQELTQQQIRNLRESLQGIKNSNELQQLDINLRKLGINPSDPTWQRFLGQAVQSLIQGKIFGANIDSMHKRNPMIESSKAGFKK